VPENGDSCTDYDEPGEPQPKNFPPAKRILPNRHQANLGLVISANPAHAHISAIAKMEANPGRASHDRSQDLTREAVLYPTGDAAGSRSISVRAHGLGRRGEEGILH
jgi:hypothetical protein